LRTRLSYALVKVTKGWESLPIEEVESLTSQAGSPASSSSTLHGRRNITTSPRTAIATIQGHAREAAKNNNAAWTSQSQSESASYRDSQPSRTYESFWREQGQKQTGIPTNFASSTSASSSLAPAVDFTSTTRHLSHPRRSETPRFTRPPVLIGRSTSDLSQNSQPGNVVPPRTPNRTSHPVDLMLQTPNQKSIQERDAIETLLFMSSPGNSSTMGHSFPTHGQASQQPSPLQAEFGALLRSAQGRNVEFADGEMSRCSDTPPLKHGARRARLEKNCRLGDGDFEKFLDNIPDTESSDEDEIEIITPRRQAAGRV
jgi:Whi5 like